MARQLAVLYLLSTFFVLFALFGSTVALAAEEVTAPTTTNSPMVASKNEKIATVTTEADDGIAEVQLVDIGKVNVKKFAKKQLASTTVQRSARSLLQICRREITKNCQKIGVRQGVELAADLNSNNATAVAPAAEGGNLVAPPPAKKERRQLRDSLRSSAVVQCLVERKDDIEEGSGCRTWLDAREVCGNAALKHPSCNSTVDSQRVCLRKIPAADLPEACASSDYYKSVRMFSMFRSRKDGERIEAGSRRARPTRMEKSINDRDVPRPTLFSKPENLRGKKEKKPTKDA